MADKKATRASYGETLKEMGAEMDNLVVMDADLSGSTKTAMFAKEYPDRFFNMGIAEQNMYACAAGLALSGKVVCASTFSMFASGRAFEIIRNMIGHNNANVKICASHAGITVGADGATHQTFEDIALMRTVPRMVVLNPSDDISAKKLIKEALKFEGPAYIRLGRAAVPVFYDDNAEFKIGKGNCLREGKDVTILATGIMVNEAMMAAEVLEGEGIDARVIDIHTIKPLDEEIILKAAEETGKIVTAEEHSVIGGMGSAVSEFLAENYPVKMKMVGQHDTFGESGQPEELKAKYGMNKDAIVKAVKSLI